MRRLLVVSAEMGVEHCGEGASRCEHWRASSGPHGACSLFRIELRKLSEQEDHPRRPAPCRNAEMEATRVEWLKRDRDLAMIEVMKAERAAGKALKPGSTGVDALIDELQRLRANYNQPKAAP